MSIQNYNFRNRKVILSFLHFIFILVLIIGIFIMKLNTNYGKNFLWFFDEEYENSDAFAEQVGRDLALIYSYVGYRNMFETDGDLDMYKVIVGINDGPGRKEEYTLDQIVRYAKKLGYYLDDHFKLAGSPMSMDDDSDDEVTVDYQSYNSDFIGNYALGSRTTLQDLVLDILETLGEYYTIRYNFIENPSNLRFRIVYCDDNGNESVYTNVPDLSLEDLVGVGHFLYVPGNSIMMDTNLAFVPESIALQEVWNPFDNDNNYLVVSVDTSYPYTDSYSSEANHYSFIRNCYIMGIALFTLGFFGIFISFILMVMVSGHYSSEAHEILLYPLDELSIELSVIIWFLTAFILIPLAHIFGHRIIDLFFIESYWPFWVKVINCSVLYGISLPFIFSFIRRYKARSIWKNSLFVRLIETIKSFFVYSSFATCTAFSYILFLAFNFFLFCGFLFFCFLFDEEGTGFAFVKPVMYLFIIALIIFDFIIFHYLFTKSIQRDLIDVAIQEISSGNTEYRIDLDHLSGKEKQMAEHINHISNGFTSALKDQVKSERLKTELITNVSHDIKTPLTSIINYIDLIKRENIQDPKILSYLGILDQKSHRLKTLIEDLVEASKASSGNIKLELANLDFVEFVHQSTGEFEERFVQRNLQLIYSITNEPLIIYADGRRLWRIFENLFSNAVKYSMEGSRVYIDVFRQSDSVIFSIKNVSERPLNISPDELTQRFVRGDVSRTTEGSGLGLSIAQSLTELHGGVFLLSIDGDLFKVSLTFPLVPSISDSCDNNVVSILS